MIPQAQFIKHPEVIKLLIQNYRETGQSIKDIAFAPVKDKVMFIMDDTLHINQNFYYFLIEDYKNILIEERDQKINDILNENTN